MADTREKLIESLKTAKLCAYPFGDQYSDGTIEKIADYLIANGVTVADNLKAAADKVSAVAEWIPASEPPQNDTEDQWVIYKAGDGYRYTTGYFGGKCWRSSITDFEIPVVGWMPLPEPPKG